MTAPSPAAHHRAGRGRRPARRPHPDQHLQPDPSRAAGRRMGGRASSTRSASTRRSSRPRRAARRRSRGSRAAIRAAPPLLIHGHLDVVPAEASEWSVDPFAGEVRDGYVWGRGAVDMKDMDAMTLALVRQWARTGRSPPRDIVLAFVSDEEAGGRQGAHYLVDHHPELFADCTEAISEVGGFSVSLERADPALPDPDGREGHQLAAAAGRAPPGHGSMVHDDNAVTRLAEAVSRIGDARVAGRHHRHGPRDWSRASPRSPAWTSTPTSRTRGCRCSGRRRA